MINILLVTVINNQQDIPEIYPYRDPKKYLTTLLSIEYLPWCTLGRETSAWMDTFWRPVPAGFSIQSLI